MSDYVTLWTIAHQAPLFIGFSRQEYWSGLSFPSPGDLPYPGIEPRSLTLQADSLLTKLQGKPPKQLRWLILCYRLCTTNNTKKNKQKDYGS